VQALADARRNGYPEQAVWEAWKKAEVALGSWRAVWEAHVRCPARRTGDGVICRLVNGGGYGEAGGDVAGSKVGGESVFGCVEVGVVGGGGWVCVGIERGR
jgi:hypothetical protein